MQPVLIFYQLSHGQDPDWILGDCVGIALPTFLLAHPPSLEFRVWDGRGQV